MPARSRATAPREDAAGRDPPGHRARWSAGCGGAAPGRLGRAGRQPTPCRRPPCDAAGVSPPPGCRPPAGAAHGGGDRAGRNRSQWRPARQEHLSAGTRWSSPLEIGGDSPPHVGRKRQPVRATALAAHHQLSRPPVDVVEPERSDLRTPESEAHEQDDDRVVPAAKRAAAIAAVQDGPDLGPGEPAGKRGPPALHGKSRLREVDPDKALEEQEAEEGPQPGDEVLRSGGRHRS